MSRLYFSSIFILFLSACGSTPTSVVREPKATDVVEPVSMQQEETQDIPALLESARNASGTEQLDALVTIVKQLSHSDCPRAEFAATELQQFPLSSHQRVTIQTAQLHCAVEQQRYDDAITLLDTMSSSAKNNENVLPLRYELALHLKSWLDAADIYYQMAENTRDSALHIWQLLNRLNRQELEQAHNGFSPLSPWLSLIEIQRSLPLSEQELNTRLQDWKQRHRNHLFAERWPEDFQEIINIPQIQRNRVAVLLPLSGRWREQGEAIKSGVLAAKFSLTELESSITFYDSNQIASLPMEDLSQADIIIGPLLKENIDVFVEVAPANIPVLMLNHMDNSPEELNKELYFYSLAPEDEAQQLAEQLLKNGVTTPVVVASQSSAYQRMQQKFVDTWQRKTQSVPLSMTFENNSTLRDGIEQLLDIADSKRRIRQIENMLTEELHSSERNRRDIDAIVVFANASQTELINPVIESSISPFAEIVPVFASSRSYSSELNKNSLRDLRHLTFVEMPWMLPSNNLRYFQNLTKSLWPNRSDTEDRLFAMGYDAFNLIPDLRFLKTVPNKSYSGLTGNIMLNQSGETTRRLSWATVDEEEIKAIAMD